MIVTLENVESTGGGYWLERPSLEDIRDQVAVTGW